MIENKTRLLCLIKEEEIQRKKKSFHKMTQRYAVSTLQIDFQIAPTGVF